MEPEPQRAITEVRCGPAGLVRRTKVAVATIFALPLPTCVVLITSRGGPQLPLSLLRGLAFTGLTALLGAVAGNDVSQLAGHRPGRVAVLTPVVALVPLLVARSLATIAPAQQLTSGHGSAVQILGAGIATAGLAALRRLRVRPRRAREIVVDHTTLDSISVETLPGWANRLERARRSPMLRDSSPLSITRGLAT